MNLNEILEQHKLWLDSGGLKGKKADLSYYDLSGMDLSGMDLRYATINYANLSGASLRHANISYADLHGADLSSVNLRDANLLCANLSYTKLPESTFIINGEPYFISIANGDFIRAGCQSHSVENWRKFSKREIAEMDGKTALKFYPRLLDIIDFYCGKGERPEWVSKGE